MVTFEQTRKRLSAIFEVTMDGSSYVVLEVGEARVRVAVAGDRLVVSSVVCQQEQAQVSLRAELELENLCWHALDGVIRWVAAESARLRPRARPQVIFDWLGVSG